jgi:hypothetical protein
MKTKPSIITIILLALLPIAGFAQPPAAPAPPAPPVPPIPPEHREDKTPKVPVTYLGVETSHIPTVVCEQLGLAKGFGLVIDYVSPDGPAAAAGVKENDIVKMLNDQILTEPDQLAKLVRSYPEGTSVTLTVLRKGQEQKISVKLGKREVSEHRHGMFGPDFQHHFEFGNVDLGDLKEKLSHLKDQMGEEKQGMIQNAVMQAQEAAQRAREEGQRAREQAQRIRERAQEKAQRVRERVEQTGGGEISITRRDDGGLKTTRIDLHKAQIAYSDDKGELNIEASNGKKILTAKDPQGKLLFSGPVETKEDLDKLPPEVRQRYDKLEQKDLPEISPVTVNPGNSDDEMDSDNEGDDDSDDSASTSVQTVSTCTFPHRAWPTSNTVLI